MTRDISLSGAFLLSPTSPPAKATVQVEICLPPLHDGAPRIRLQAMAQVVRVEPSALSKGACGFAVVSVTGFKFAPLSPDEIAAPSSELGARGKEKEKDLEW